jgi:hypothetical protein
VGPGAFLTERFARDRNITHVINCAFDSETPDWWKRDFSSRYACIRAVDSPIHNIIDWYPAFEQALRTFLREGNGVVYVHCQAGMNRSACLALTYVLKNFRQPIETFLPAVHRQRPCMFQNVVFMNQVKEFINGCIQSEEGKRNDVSDTGNRDAGLSSPGDHPNP